jgi:hypothetical protein
MKTLINIAKELEEKFKFYLRVLYIFILLFIISLLFINKIENIVYELNYKIYNISKIGKNIKKEFEKDEARIRAKGLLTNNPEVHYKIALLEYKKNNYIDALEEVELGIGLLEMNNSNKEYKIKFYILYDKIINEIRKK